ncbi:hypothetical protein GCM10027051_05820 [Niabella terrae]
MKRSTYYLLALLFVLLLQACSKSGSGPDPVDPDPDPDPPPTGAMKLPKNQLRAAWMATVFELDWPRGDHNAATQKQQYIDYLELFQSMNMNAVFVQVKAKGDAFYNSAYEPWSASITGTRGQDPGYDVLQFMIDEAHARDIEFHAWLNPYRIGTRANSGVPYPALHPSVDPSWVVSHEKLQIYNPAVPEVRQRLADIVKDIITKYEVDGIHFDDYFYPYPSQAGQMVSDQADYQTYGAGYSTIEDFRRGNVDKAIELVHDVIVANKPEVVFSISPGSDFTTNKNTLYADVVKWASEGWMDIVIPQLYHDNTFASKLAEWDRFNNKPPLMVGHSLDLSSVAQIGSQLQQTALKKAVMGNLLYSAHFLYTKAGMADIVKDRFADPAVIPFLGRAIAPDPTTATNLRLEGGILKWSRGANLRSVVYFTSDLKNTAKVLTITTEQQLSVSAAGYYAVVTLNADNKQSAATNPVQKK